LACTHRLHVGGDTGITRKYRNPEALLTSWKFFFCYSKDWWDAYTETIHQKLLHLV